MLKLYLQVNLGGIILDYTGNGLLCSLHPSGSMNGFELRYLGQNSIRDQTLGE